LVELDNTVAINDRLAIDITYKKHVVYNRHYIYMLYNLQINTCQWLCILLSNFYPPYQHLRHLAPTLLCLTRVYRYIIIQSNSIFNFPFLLLLSNTTSNSQSICRLPLFTISNLICKRTSNSSSNSDPNSTCNWSTTPYIGYKKPVAQAFTCKPWKAGFYFQ